MNAANCPIEKFKVSKHKFTLTRSVQAKKKIEQQKQMTQRQSVQGEKSTLKQQIQ